MRPSEKYLKLMRILRLCSSICGADVLDKSYKVNGITRCVIIFILGYFTCVGYTFYIKISTNFIYTLESTCMVGAAVQGTVKLFSGIIGRKTLVSQNDLLTSIYARYEAKGKDYTLLLDNCISRVRVVLQIAAGLYGAALSAVNIMPLSFLIFTGSRFLPMQFCLPLLDTDTNFGYFTTMGIHVICVVFGLAGNFASDMFMLVYFAHSALFVDIFKIKTKELNEFAKDYGSRKATDKFEDVLQWHQIYTNFVGDNDKYFFWINFTQIITSGMSIVLSLVLMFISDWPGSYVYSVLAFAMLYLYCGLGTLIEITNEKFMDEIYAIHWYLLTTPQQKGTQFMLMKSQSAKQITIGGVATLSVSTGLQVTKTAYSFLMMMLNFLY